MLKIIIFILISQSALAKTYFVKAAGGSGTGLNDAYAWNLSKLNTAALKSGDSVLFKRGDIIYGQLIPKSNGIYYGAYNTGVDPVISGFVQPSLALYKTNIYSAPLDLPSVNLVLVNGYVKSMGRYPNSGYLPYISHTGTSITGTIIPFDITGGEVVIRKARWIIDRHTIVSKSGNTINYSISSDYGNNGAYLPLDGNGFFIQGSLETLDQDGEWFYDKGAKRIYVYSSTLPTIKVSSQPQNLYINYWNNLSFNNLVFEGGNLYGAYIIGTSNINFKDCTFRNQGGSSIWGSYLNTISISGTINTSLNNGVFFEQDCNNVKLRLIVSNSGMIAGAGRSGDGNQQGVLIVGNNNDISNCTIVNSGYISLHLEGNNLLAENNYIDSFGSVKDDGAGIYIYSGNVISTNRVIRNNVITNAIGSYPGAEGSPWENYGKEAGIYLDGGSNHVIVVGNAISKGGWAGIVANGNTDNQVVNNTVSGFPNQLLILQYNGLLVRNLSVIGNRFTSTGDQQDIFIHSYVNDDFSQLGLFSNNTYSGRFKVNKDYAGGGETNLSLKQWQGFNLDQTSITTSKELIKTVFFYNDGSTETK